MKAPTPKWMLPRRNYFALYEPPLPLADRRGIFICAYFSYRESQATQAANYKT